MELARDFFEVLLNLDKYLGFVIRSYGAWTYAILFLIILCETGLVVANFLPGDALLFAAGAFAALGSLDVRWVVIFLSIAAIAGDNMSYWIGRLIGSKVISEEKFPLSSFGKRGLERTHRFYNRHGVKTILFARFVPMLRSLVPFVAGIGQVKYRRFVLYNFICVTVWSFIFVFGGYFFGRIPFVKNNLGFVILAVVFILVLIGLVGLLRQRHQS